MKTSSTVTAAETCAAFSLKLWCCGRPPSAGWLCRYTVDLNTIPWLIDHVDI
jgi:hypothetical protein